MARHVRTALAGTALLALAAARVAGAADAEEVAEASHPAQCGTGVHAFEARGFHGLPEGDVFCTIIADPKAMRSFATYQWGHFPTTSNASTVGSIGVADTVGLFRIGGPNQGEGLQLSLEAGVFAQFDLKKPSKDLLNADYLVGFPLTYRRAGFSARLRVYHQSSHLGDELQLHSGLEPGGLAYEALEGIISQELGPIRVYGGGEWLFDRAPKTIDPWLLHGGAELRIGPSDGIRLVLALDVKSPGQQSFQPAWSAKGGFEVAHWHNPEHPPRVFSLLAEYYDGPSPYGQFFAENSRYWGVGLHFML
jgi:hypothetical protein